MIGSFQSLEFAQVAVDLSLMGALLLLCYRVLRTPAPMKMTKRLMELDGTLRSLIKEAESSGKGLNDELRARQTELKRLLYELDAVEGRLNKPGEAAEESRAYSPRANVHSPSPQASQPQATQSQSSGREARPEMYTPQQTPLSHESRQQSAPVAAPHQARVQEHMPVEYLLDPIDTPPPPRFETAVKTRTTAQSRSAPLHHSTSGIDAMDRATMDRATVDRATMDRSLMDEASVNQSTYQQSSALQGASYQGNNPQATIHQAIEKRVDSKTPSYESSVANVYAAAEQLLRSGLDLGAVAQQTKLPADQIQVLAQLVKRDTRPRSAVIPDADSRLGVLGKGSYSPVGEP